MDTEQTEAPSTLGVADAEASVAQARATLDEARQVTKAAEEAYRARQADESAALAAYEQAAHRVRDAYAAERARIEEQMRTAEHELKALDARLSDLEVGGTSEPASVEPVSARPAERGEREVAEHSAGRPPLDPAAEGAEGAAYEDDWYRTLKQRSENGSTPQSE